MKSLMSLARCVLIDMGTLCSVDTSRDLTTITVRYEHEGDSFLGITLADFGKAFERSLDQGFVDDAGFSSFKKSRGLPAFLQGFLRQVFCIDSGILLAEPNKSAVYAVRQITLMWAKMAAECSDTRNRKAIESYYQTEKKVEAFTRTYRYDVGLRSSFRRMARLLYGDLFGHLEAKIDEGLLIPRHGPGMTADGRIGNQKWKTDTWTCRMEKVFFMDTYAIPNFGHYESLEDVNVLRPGFEKPVKVVLVPKTMKTPRIIAEEPAHVMYVQQALKDAWYEAVDTGIALCSAFIQFKRESQQLNRELAHQGSVNGELATLDLSAASDSVSIAHVADLLHSFPSLKEAVFASRSTRARLPKGDVIRLWKFASMGSALCFPVEATVFLTVIFCAIERELGRPLSQIDIRQLRGKVRVFGDDIIVPKEYAVPVAEALALYGFEVNHAKSFWTGLFRESCGGDYYAGMDVSIVRLRDSIPDSRKDAQQVIRLVAFRNLMYKSMNWTTARYCDRLLGKILHSYPAVAETSAALGRHSYLGYDSEWEDRHLHSPRVRAWMVRAPLPANAIDGNPALSKVLFYQGEEPQQDGHLVRSGRPKRVNISLGSVQPY